MLHAPDQIRRDGLNRDHQGISFDRGIARFALREGVLHPPADDELPDLVSEGGYGAEHFCIAPHGKPIGEVRQRAARFFAAAGIDAAPEANRDVGPRAVDFDRMKTGISRRALG